MALDDYQVDVFLHEVRNPLTTLTVLIRLLQKRLGHDDANFDLTVSLLRECQRLESMVAQLKDHGADRVPPYRVMPFLTDLYPVYAALVRSHDLHLEWQVDPDLALVHIYLAPDSFRQVLDNLIHNACKYNRPGGQVSLVAQGDPAHQTMQLIIGDSGCGLTPEQQAQMFAPYQRFSDDQPGQGLGLAIVKAVLEKAHGSIEVKSVPDQGSQFIVTLPATYA
ncbi:MAG: hypothetical protein OHK0012_03950 [Synechococcales cyanobacterium]